MQILLCAARRRTQKIKKRYLNNVIALLPKTSAMYWKIFIAREILNNEMYCKTNGVSKKQLR